MSTPALVTPEQLAVAVRDIKQAIPSYAPVVQTIIGACIALLGGILAQVIAYVFGKKARTAAYLKEQLCNLYGPLQLYLSVYSHYGKLIFRLAAAAYPEADILSTVEFGDEFARLCRDQPFDGVISVVRDYIHHMDAQMNLMRDVIQDQYAYIDPNDIEIVTEFMMNRLSTSVEFSAGQHRVEDEVRERLPQIVQFMPDFVKQINDKFLAKQKELEELGG